MQVQRIFRINAYYYKGENARTDVYEVARYWLDENGKTALTALQRTMGRYLDCFLYGSGLELRNDNYTYQYISDCYIYPKYTVIPKLRRNGLKGSFADIAPQKLMKTLCQAAGWKRYSKADANVTSSISSTTREIWISVGRPIKSCCAGITG